MKPLEIKKVLEAIRDTHDLDCHFCFEDFTQELIKQFKHNHTKETELKNIIKKTYIKRFGERNWENARENTYKTYKHLDIKDNYDKIYWYKD